MISVDQAECIILGLVQPLVPDRDCEVVSLLDGRDRILAAPVTSQLDFPHWDNSAMDGYAVRYEDVQHCSAANPVRLEVIESIPAGYQPQKSVQLGQAARILTGSVMPVGADTIVIQEETQRSGNHVTILTAPQPQAFVRHKGAFYQAGNALLNAGVRLQAAEIAVLAAAQCAEVQVFRRPRVAILSTGDELVAIDQALQPGQIVDSNQYALANVVAEAGAIPILMGVVPDRPEALRTAIEQAIATADVVISSGGVSVGDYDYVDEILANLGAEIHIRAIAVKPGKPLTFATISRQEGRERQETGDRGQAIGVKAAKESESSDTANSAHDTLYFGLPGNPVSALVTFWRFVEPALRKLAGLPEAYWRPTIAAAITTQDLRSDGKRESYLWGCLSLSSGAYRFKLAAGSHSSGNLINLAGTNSLGIVPIGTTHIPAGSVIQVMQIATPVAEIE